MTIANRFRHSSIINKMTLALTLSALVPLLIIGAYTMTDNREVLQKNHENNMDVAIRQVRENLELMISDGRQDLLFLASVPPIKGILRAQDAGGFDEEGKSSLKQWTDRLSTIFKGFADAKGHYFMLRYVDALGNELVKVTHDKGVTVAHKSEAMSNKADRYYFKDTLDIDPGQVYVSNFDLNTVGGKIEQPIRPVLRLTTPFTDEAGTKRGILIATIEGHFLTDVLSRAEAHSAGSFYLVNSQGDYIYHPDRNRIMGSQLSKNYNFGIDYPDIKLENNNDIHTLEDQTDHELSYSAVHPHRSNLEHAWFLVHTMQKDIIFAALNHFQTALVILLVAALGLAITLGIWLSRNWIVKPIRSTLDAMNLFASDRMDARAKILANDEVGQVANAFNAMADQHQENLLREREQLEQLREAADIDNQVRHLSDCLAAVSSGDLTAHADISGNEHLVKLGNDLNQMSRRLGRLAANIGGASESIDSEIEQIQSAVSNQVTGAQQQAAAVNETTSTLEQIAAISTQTQQRAEELGRVAEQTQSEGERGLSSVDRTVSGMEAIRKHVEGIAQNILSLSQQTQQIGDITTTVSSLAHQLKMLALNASIEAAKAGDAGKGFAVVAAEVRELAEQSQNATAQVSVILQDIQHATDKAVISTEEGTKGVDEGMALVTAAGESVRSLTEVINSTAIASRQIVSSVRQEATGITQITQAMHQIRDATRSFEGTARVSRDSVGSLAEVAANLRSQIKVYKY